MRRLFFGLVLFVCLLIAGCADASLPTSAAAPPGDPESAAPTATPAPADVARVRLPGDALQDLLAEHDLAYSDPFSQEYPDILSVPSVVHYSKDQLYYTSFEEMPFIGEQYPMTAPEQVCEGLYRYDLSTGEKVRMGDVSQAGYSSGEFLFTQDAYYRFPCSFDQTKSTLAIKRLDLASGQPQVIAQIDNGDMYVSSDQTGSGTCAFLIRIAGEEQNSQRIYIRGADQELRLIYDSAQSGLEAPAFSALSAGEETLFLLQQTAPAGKLVTEVVEMDLDGTICGTIPLPGLKEYSDPDYFADKLYVTGEYIFVKWYNCGEQLPYFSAFKLADGEASAVWVPENAPCYLINKRPVKGRYFLFSAFPDGMDYTANTYASHLYVLDAQNDRFTGVSLPLAQDVVFNNMVCNEQGDLVMNLAEKTHAQARLQDRLLRIAFEELEALL